MLQMTLFDRLTDLWSNTRGQEAPLENHSVGEARPRRHAAFRLSKAIKFIQEPPTQHENHTSFLLQAYLQNLLDHHDRGNTTISVTFWIVLRKRTRFVLQRQIKCEGQGLSSLGNLDTSGVCTCSLRKLDETHGARRGTRLGAGGGAGEAHFSTLVETRLLPDKLCFQRDLSPAARRYFDTPGQGSGVKCKNNPGHEA